MESLLPSVDALAALVTWRECLDVGLIAVAFFFLYHTLRAAGTWKIAVGVLLAGAIFVLAGALDLRGIGWILSNLSGVAVLGLIVIFQPELRRVLERAASLRRSPAEKEGSGLAGLLAEAAFLLAAERRGALLVLPGKDSVKSSVSEGVRLDGVPSVPLLLSLFDPHSPGHDGAVIVEKGRVSAFGVRLPLSRSNLLTNRFGTRHHAALGLSELTDALVVAVSEERGTVIAFSRGTLEVLAAAPDLARRLLHHWGEGDPAEASTRARRGKRRLLRETAVSGAAAVLFWAAVVLSGGRIVETTFTVPVEYSALPPTLSLVGEKPSEVKIHLSGLTTDLGRISAAQTPVVVDLARLGPGRHRLTVTDANLKLPRGIRLLSADPSTVDLTLRVLHRKELAVIPRLVGRLPEGLRLASAAATPGRLPALVPRDGGDGRPPALETAPIDLGSVDRTTTVTREVVGPPGVLPLGDPWPEVKVTLTVRGRRGRR